MPLAENLKDIPFPLQASKKRKKTGFWKISKNKVENNKLRNLRQQLLLSKLTAVNWGLYRPRTFWMLEVGSIQKGNKGIIFRRHREQDSLNREAWLSSRCRFIWDTELPAVCLSYFSQGTCTLCLFSVNKQDYTKWYTWVLFFILRGTTCQDVLANCFSKVGNSMNL